MRTLTDLTKAEIDSIKKADAEDEIEKYLSWQYGTTIKVIQQIRNKKESKRQQKQNSKDAETNEPETEESTNEN